jgi:hypothetical protein
MQSRLTLKGHKSLEFCCLVIHLTSVSTISYAKSNGGIFVLTERIKPEIRPVHFLRILQWWGKTTKGPIFLALPQHSMRRRRCEQSTTGTS